MKMHFKTIIFILWIMGYLIVETQPSSAVFNLLVSPLEGGYDLKFGKVGGLVGSVSKEIQVRIVSDLGKKYQLVQTLLEPLSNEKGMSIPLNNFSVYAVRKSNKYGTMGVEIERPVSLGRTIIYTSNSQGLSDDFKLVYVLKGPFNIPGGLYRGRIAFTLESIDSTQSPVTTVLNISAEIEAEFGIEIKTISGIRLITLDSNRPQTMSSDVFFEIKGVGNEFRLYQLLSKPLESSEGKNLSSEAIDFKISRARRGSGPLQFVPLSSYQTLIYSSSEGEADSFVLTYNLSEPEKQKAGRYTSKLIYLLETKGQQSMLSTFDLEVEIAPIFNLEVKPELGGIIEFRNLRPGGPPQSSEVSIEIKSNLGKRYQVSQRIDSELVNKEGNKIPLKYFTLREESLETKGTLKFSKSTEIRLGEMILFVSDIEGTSDKFKVIYELEPPLDLRPGNYSTGIIYSISEI
ncbi:MAG: hypothetical protein NC898_04580 [Candidatus Omnitrophica bacterium]|nr:hypothetical protein [Candidatus Omnitrophota bacterium]